MKQVCISGRLGKSAELRRTQNGDPVLSFSVAVNDGYGENKSTMWFDCSMFGKRGEKLVDFLEKGKEVTITGELGRREHAGKTYLTVRVGELDMHGGKQGETRERSQSYDRDDPRTTGGGAARELDDEIPF